MKRFANYLNITSITTDNIPTQILSFAPWSTESYLRSNKFNDPKIKIIIFCSCSSHVMHLVAKSVQEENAPSFIKNVYSKFFQASLHLDQFSEASIEKPPKPIMTRWLLVFNQIKFMRKHDIFFVGFSNYEYPAASTKSFLFEEDCYNNPLRIDFNEHPEHSRPHKLFLKIAHKKNINIDLFSPYNFRNYMFMAKILWPLWQSILFLNRMTHRSFLFTRSFKK